MAPTAVDRVAVSRAVVEVDGRPLELHVTTRGRLLLRITETAFVVTGPDRAAAGGRPVQLRVGHTGMARRTGIRVAVENGGEPARRLAARLRGSGDLVAAMLPLDFTDFTVVEEDGRLLARIVLMGASMTRMRVPPTTTYVRLHDDQRDALLATVDALDACFGVA
nr:DUF3156 family protein [Salsipaludibacter albus]